MKKALCLVLTALISIGLLAGCNNAKDVTTGESKTAGEETKSTGKINEFGWEIPEKTIEITYYAGQDNPDNVSKNSEQINKFYLEKFNVKLNKIVYDTDMTERLSLMLASNDYPDVITGLSTLNAANWKDLGKAVDLAPYIDKYGSNIKSRMGDLYKRFVDEDGKVYSLSAGWGLLPITDYAVHIRNDWYTEIGKPQFTTPDEYYETLKKLVEKHPQNDKGEKVFALSTYKTANVYNTLGAMWGLKNGWKEDSEHNLIHWTNTTEGLMLTKYLNRIYRDGLLDPDSFVNTFDDWKAKVSAHRVAGHVGSWWVTWNAGHEVWQKADPKWTEEMRYTQHNVIASGVEKSTFNPKNTLGWSRTIITDKAKNPADIVKWMNFEISDIGTKIVGFGVPNEERSVWTYNGNDWKWVDKYADGVINGTYDFTNSDFIGQGMHWMVAGVQPMADGSNVWFDQNFNDRAKWKKLMNDNMKDTFYDFSAYYGITLTPDNPISVQNQQVTDLVNSMWASAVTAKTESECEAKFNELKTKLQTAGVKQLEDFYSTEYKKNINAWK